MKSIQLRDLEAEKLEKFIYNNGIKLNGPKSQYEKYRVHNSSFNFILYKSLKLVFEDTPNMKKLINSISTKETNYDFIIGSDETGKGEWYGPLVVVAVALKSSSIIEYRLRGVTDSKKLDIKTIMKIAENVIKRQDLVFHKIVLRPAKYNDLYLKFLKENKNLNDLMAWAHSAVIKEVLNKLNYKDLNLKIIIDKFDYKKTENRLKNLPSKRLRIIQKSKGESETPVALASIIAKYYFEEEVQKLNNEHSLDLKSLNTNNLLNISKEIIYNIGKIHFKNVPY